MDLLWGWMVAGELCHTLHSGVEYASEPVGAEVFGYPLCRVWQ